MDSTHGAQPERRSSRRQNVQIFIAKPDGDFVEHFGRVNNNGFYFETDGRLQKGERVQARFVLHGLGVEITAEGEVVYLSSDEEHAEVGVKFIDMAEDARHNLAHWLDMIEQAAEQT